VPLRILVALAAVLTFSSSPLVAQEILTLEEALRTALVQNPNVASATAAAAAATSSRWADWGAFLPTARLNANLSSTDFTNVTFVTPEGSAGFIDPPLKDTRQSSNLGVSLGLGILNPDRITNVKAGAAREDAADMRLTAAERVVIRDVKQAYFEALKQQQLVAVAERQLESRLQDLDLTERRYRIAAASRRDLLGAEIDASDVNEAHPDDTELIDVDLVPDADGLDPRRLTEAAKASNPNLQALRYDEKAAAASKWSAKAQYLPTIDIGLSFGRNKELAEDENLFDFSPANTSATFNIVGSWNLLSGFTRKRQTAQADQQLRQTRAELLAQELLIEKDVRDLVNELTRRSRRLELLERNVRLASERLELARQQYRLGSIPYFNLQQAIDRLQQAEQQLFQERYDYLIGWASLEEKVGGDLGGR
jgi:outer membrane protein